MALWCDASGVRGVQPVGPPPVYPAVFFCVLYIRIIED